MEPLGYRVAIHNSITTPLLLAGVPRTFAILNGTFAAATVFGMQTFYALPICVVAHVVAMVLTKKDPYFFKILMRHLHQKKYYKV